MQQRNSSNLNVITVEARRVDPPRSSLFGRLNALLARFNRSVGRARRRQVPRVRTRDLPKFKDHAEDARRKRTATVAGLLSIVFGTLAVACAVSATSWVPMPFGSGLLIEVVLALAPQLWPLAVLHNSVLAGLCLLLVFACTTAHVEIPADPRPDTMVVWRRQEAFVAPSLSAFGLLLALGVALHLKVHPLAGAVVESSAVAAALRAIVRGCVPIARVFVFVEIDPARGGVGNRISIGGGLSLRGHPVLVIPHDRLVTADVETSLIEFCFGLAKLRVVYRDDHGTLHVVRVRAFASAALAHWTANFLRGEFKVARSRVVLDNPFSIPVQPWPARQQAAH